MHFSLVTPRDFGRSNKWARSAPKLRHIVHPHTTRNRDKIMTAIEKLINDVVLTPVAAPNLDDSGLPHVTHEGVLRIAGHELRVRQLSTGQRVFLAEDVEKLFSPPQ